MLIDSEDSLIEVLNKWFSTDKFVYELWWGKFMFFGVICHIVLYKKGCKIKICFCFINFHLNPDWCAFMTLTATSLPYHLGTKGHKCHTLKEKNINERGGQSLKARFHNYRAYCVLSFLFFFFLVNTFLFLSPLARSLFLSLSFHSSFLLFHPFSIYFFLVYPILFSLYVLALNSWFPPFHFWIRVWIVSKKGPI